jgi:hypothetical protein
VTGSPDQRMMRKPITAFHNPITAHGRLKAKSASASISTAPKPPADSLQDMNQRRAAIVIATAAAKSARRATNQSLRAPAGANASVHSDIRLSPAIVCVNRFGQV